jgi:2,3-bisphosphoglycerate-independent phosphoglycerate mutase
MKAFEITEAGKEALLSRKFQMVRVNYANPDMVCCPTAVCVFSIL